mmetsp:Transcript_13500/g.19745  ORF Transcript_13500/g.19745 Transcript_13500/m.19745 type:complete len:421 (-) Transcript_13500:88-1350(-)
MCIADKPNVTTPSKKARNVSPNTTPSPIPSSMMLDKKDHPVLVGSLTPPAGVQLVNFSPGPTCLADEVEEEIKDLFNFDRPCSMYLSHRSPEFVDILQNAVELSRKAMAIPDNYEILFTHGGGHGQFAAVPMNLCTSKDEKATYLVSGTWSKRAAVEAAKYCTPSVISSENDDGTFSSFPTLDKIDPESKYVYLCSNETVNGLELHRLPRGIQAPLVIDASSDFSTKPIEWEACNVGVLYACASKNIGHPGITMTVIRKDLLDSASDICPGVLNYKTNAESGNLWNTIPTFNVEVVGVVMKWMLRMGGVQQMEEWSITKSSMIYDVVDNSDGFYSTPIHDKTIRSRMNVPFDVAGGDEDLTNDFLIQAWQRGIVGLRTLTPFGYGKYLRASLYNGVCVANAAKLRGFMLEFAANNAHMMR